MRTLKQAFKEIENRPVTDDLIQDLLPDSSSAYMLICGRPGIGKTFLALNLLFALATGTPWLSFKTKQCKVGYLSFEGAESKIKKRLEILTASFPEVWEGDNFSWEHRLPITLIGPGYDALAELLTGVDVAVIDPLRPLVAGDYTTPKDANIFLKHLAKLQNETSTRLILIHHIRKPERHVKVYPEDLQFEVKGASEYVEAATTVLLMERPKQSRDAFGKFESTTPDNRTLHFAKVKDAPTDIQPITLTFNRESLLYQPITNHYDAEEAAEMGVLL